MENKEKVISLFKFIQELSSMRISKITDITKQIWYCFIRDIPEDLKNITIKYRDRVETESTTDDVILEVKKPEFQPCPEPEREFFFWLLPEWDKFNSTVRLKEILDPDADPEMAEHFKENSDRVSAYEKWLVKRNAWAEKQKPIDKVRKLFVQLYQLHVELERDSDTLELMVGDGILNDSMHVAKNHPILLRRLKTSFDPTENIIRFLDTDTESELYTMFINEIEEINYGSIKTITEKLYINDYHPLDRNDAHDFLKESVHLLCSESKFLDIGEKRPDNSSDRLFLQINPVFFVRKRINGPQRTIEAIIRNIEDTGKIPAHILDIVGGGIIDIPEDASDPTLSQQLAAVGGEDVEILLSKEANKEQLEIAQRIARFNAVLVQGPPGTGKTHTIANLLGHFLASGKSVLVTSHTKKALSVLKEQVPVGLRNLCVSVLDDSNTDMERSIDGIADYLSRYTSSELKKKMDSAKRSREEIIEKLSAVRQNIFKIKYSEFSTIAYNGESISPSQAADFVCTHAEELSYIPGKVSINRSLPLAFEELSTLYRSNQSLSVDEERELAYGLPDPKKYFSSADFRRHIGRIQESRREIKEIAECIGYTVNLDSSTCLINLKSASNSIHVVGPTLKALGTLNTYLESFPKFCKWRVYAAVDGLKGGGYLARWHTLIQKITDTVAFSDSLVEEQFGKFVSFGDGIDISQVENILSLMNDLYNRKGKITAFDRLKNKKIEAVEQNVKINNAPISSFEDCQITLHQIQIKKMRIESATYWDELLAIHDVPKFSALDRVEPEHIARNMTDDIKRSLEWYEREYEQLVRYITSAGMDADEIFIKNKLDSDVIATEKILTSIEELLPKLVNLSFWYLELFQAQQTLDTKYNDILIGERKRSIVCNQIKAAYTNHDCELYEKAYSQLEMLHGKYILKEKRNELLARVYDVAPEWANEIRNRNGIHGGDTVPSDIEVAWRWKQYSGIISELTAQPFEELQKQSISLSQSYREKTTNLAEWSAWYHLLKKTESNLDMRMALNGWKLTVRRIGHGTGRNAPMLREQARKLMAQCQEAVPAWIMPINKALESLVPGSNEFDVVIVDEASQSDISALAITYMARKVIIVGDDKQVSPISVGISIDKTNALAEMYIKDILPNWQLYTANSSLYDIASTVFQPLMLREHFRCVPEIIGFSNKLSYDFKIKPLRDTSNCMLVPPVINYRTEGKRHDSQKTNLVEAKTIVALIKSCLEMKEYNGKTFGVISLLGDEQPELISKLIFEKIDAAVIETRKILCGNPAHFQGDQRDVIFLTVIDSNEKDGPLSLLSEGADQSVKKRYNVAASRAKDQMWVVHSLDSSKDLKTGDMRKEILDYSVNPKTFLELASQVETHAESPFESDVCKALVARGYRMVQQWKVGAYRIDMVAIDDNKKVAIECDGDLFHSGEEKVREDMERQTILERLGWRFIRIRGSEYYRDPERTMNRVFSEIESLEIHPWQPDQAAEQKNSELLTRVKERATEILAEWNDTSTADGTFDTIRFALLADRFKSSEQHPRTSSASEKGKNTSPPPKPKSEPRPNIDSSKVTQISLFERDSRPNVEPEREPIKRESQKNEFTRMQTTQNNHYEKNDKIAQHILRDLKQNSLEFIDNYAKSSIIWVIDNAGVKGALDSISTKYEVVCAYERRGAILTNNRAAWRILIK